MGTGNEEERMGKGMGNGNRENSRGWAGEWRLGREKMVGNGERGIRNREDDEEWRRGN